MGASPTLLTLLFVAVTLAGSTAVSLFRSWRWLPSLAFVLAAPQLASWLAGDPDSTQAVVALTGFWLVNIIAAAGEEVRIRRDDLRPSSAILVLANATFLLWGIFVVLDGNLAAWRGSAIALASLAHVLVGGWFLARQGWEHLFGNLVAGTGVALLAIAAFVQLGAPAVPVAWAAEAVALAWLAVRRRHVWSAGAALILGGMAIAHLVVVEYPLQEAGIPAATDVRSAAPEPGGRLAARRAARPRGHGGSRPGPLDPVRARRRRGDPRRLCRDVLGDGSGPGRRPGADRSDRSPAGPAGRPAAHGGWAAAGLRLDGLRLVRLGRRRSGRPDGGGAPVLDGVPAAGPRDARCTPVPQRSLPVARADCRGSGGRWRPRPGPLAPFRPRRSGHPADRMGARLPGDGRRPRRAAGRAAAHRGRDRPRAGPVAGGRAVRDDVGPRPVRAVRQCGRSGRVDGRGPVCDGHVPRSHGLGSGHPAAGALHGRARRRGRLPRALGAGGGPLARADGVAARRADRGDRSAAPGSSRSRSTRTSSSCSGSSSRRARSSRAPGTAWGSRVRARGERALGFSPRSSRWGSSPARIGCGSWTPRGRSGSRCCPCGGRRSSPWPSCRAVAAARRRPFSAWSVELDVVAGVAIVYGLSAAVVDALQRQVGGSVAVEELAKQAQVALSVCWTALGVGALVVGLARHRAMLRHAGFALLALATAKVFVIDLASLGRRLPCAGPRRGGRAAARERLAVHALPGPARRADGRGRRSATGRLTGRRQPAVPTDPPRGGLETAATSAHDRRVPYHPAPMRRAGPILIVVIGLLALVAAIFVPCPFRAGRARRPGRSRPSLALDLQGAGCGSSTRCSPPRARSRRATTSTSCARSSSTASTSPAWRSRSSWSREATASWSRCRASRTSSRSRP